MVAVAVWHRAEVRRTFILSHGASFQSAFNVIATLAKPGTRVAFYDGGGGPSGSALGFDCWGNYQFASSRFDKLLLRRYPDYTCLRFPEIPRLIQAIL